MMTDTRLAEINEKLNEFGPEKWIEALRNPLYRHTRRQLGWVGLRGRTDDSDAKIVVNACCLGVLAHAAGVCDNDATILSSTIEVNGNVHSLDPQAAPAWLTVKVPACLMGGRYSSEALGMRPLIDELVYINDHHTTNGYERQIEMIEKYAVPAWRAQQGSIEQEAAA